MCSPTGSGEVLTSEPGETHVFQSVFGKDWCLGIVHGKETWEADWGPPWGFTIRINSKDTSLSVKEKRSAALTSVTSKCRCVPSPRASPLCPSLYLQVFCRELSCWLGSEGTQILFELQDATLRPARQGLAGRPRSVSGLLSWRE